jgi:hypothetical protein
VLGQLRAELAGYLNDPEKMARLIRKAEAAGFRFDG